jgi:NAD(P)-dependent dehydrogenase (short-subunit alcohol dehydrogenase family)
VSVAAFDLAGRTALVTGCRRGIGKAAAVALAAAGADIVGVSVSLEPGSGIAPRDSLRQRPQRPTASLALALPEGWHLN